MKGGVSAVFVDVAPKPKFVIRLVEDEALKPKFESTWKAH
jgi:hypothetical protein